MTSIDIYSAISVSQSIQICFVYKFIQISTGKWYIGSHTSKSAHPNDGYTCSSKIVKPMILEHPEDWTRIILEIGTAKDMVLLEYEILTCLNASASKYSYNRHNGGNKFSNAGMILSEETRKRMSIGKLGKAYPKNRKSRIMTDETKMKLSIINKGKITSEETRKKLSIAGKCHSLEARTKISIANKGRKRSEDVKTRISLAKIGKPRPILICSHCNKSGGDGNMHRWHFDNCKFKK